VLIEDQKWRKLVIFVTQKYGTPRKTSEHIEKAIEEYLDRHR
jgi:hypothetical protein